MSPDNLISASRMQGFTPSELYAVRSIWAIRDCWRFLVLRSVLISFGVMPARRRRGLDDVVVPAPPDFGALEHVQDHKAVFEEKLVSIRDSVLYRFIVVGYHQSSWSRGGAKPCGHGA